MRVRVDDRDWQPEEGRIPDDRGDILDRVRADAFARGRVVLSIRVDGQEIDEEGFRSLSGGQEACVSTQPIRDLVRDSLEQMRRYFPALVKGMGGIADRLEEERTEEAMTLLRQGLEGIGWVLQVLDNTRFLLGIASEDPRSEGYSSARSALSRCLEEAEKALAAGRFFELSFRIREEILPALGGLQPFAEEMERLSGEPVQ